MIIYHGSINKDIQLVTKEKINCLITYASYKKHVWQPWWKSLFIDSGAFSVHNSGKTIDIEKYIDYIFQWKEMKKPIVYASLDVIGDAKAGMKNYKKMLARGLEPIPTYHYSEPLEVLLELSSITSYIGLGATVGLSTPRRKLFFDKIFSLYPDPTKIGFHGFGITAPPLIKAYPWASIDSTMAMKWAMFGQILTPWGRFTAMDSIARKHHVSTKLGPNGIEIMKKWLGTFGVKWDILLTSEKEGQMSKELVNIKALEELREHCPEQFTTKQIFLF